MHLRAEKIIVAGTLDDLVSVMRLEPVGRGRPAKGAWPLGTWLC